MAQLKLDLIFEARGRGWRETYYADFAVGNFGEMLPIAQKLATSRIAMSAPPVEIKAYSVSDPLTPNRQGQTFRFPVRLTAPAWPEAQGATDPSTAINIGYINATTNATRRIQLRGCPDGIVNNFGELTGPLFGAWQNKFAAWREVQLGVNQQGLATNYGWFSRLPVAVPAGEVSYTYADGAHVPTFTFPVDFFAADDVGKNRYIRIRGLNGGRSPLNGELVVYVLTRATARATRPIAAGPMAIPGMAQRYAALPTFVVATNIGIEGAGRRAPGAPLLYTPGRSRARARS